MILVPAQPYNSSQALYRHLPALLQQHHVVLHVIWILWNDELKLQVRVTTTNDSIKIKVLVYLT